MFRSILFPVDFSDRSRAVLPFVHSMARRSGARVTLLHVIEPPMQIYSGMAALFPAEFDYDEVKMEIARRLQELACTGLPKIHTAYQVEIGLPAETITAYACAGDIDLIAMPTHGYGAFRKMLPGSVTAKVLHDVKIPVWTSAHAPEPTHRAHPEPRVIIAALDFGPEAPRVLKTAVEVARKAGAKLEILHCDGDDARQFEARSRELLNEITRDDIMTECRDAGVTIERCRPGEGLTGTIRLMALDKRADLVVIGRGSIRDNVLRRLAAHAYTIICEAPCPVLSI